MKNYTPLIAGFLVLILVLGSGIYYFSSKGESDVREYTPPVGIVMPDGKGEEGYVEEDTTVSVDSDSVRLVTLQGVDGNTLTFTRDGKSQELPIVSTEELVLACTSQPLAEIDEVDFDLVSKINLVNSEFLANYSFAEMDGVIFVDDKDGAMTVHSIAISDENCNF